MNHIILASGRGSRLGPLTDNLPKSLLTVRGIPLIQNQILHFRSIFPESSTYITTGYLHQCFNQLNLGDIHLLHNLNWESMNMTGTLGFALSQLDSIQDTFISYGDCYFGLDFLNTF